MLLTKPSIVELQIFDDFFPTLEEYKSIDELKKRLQELLKTYDVVEKGS